MVSVDGDDFALQDIKDGKMSATVLLGPEYSGFWKVWVPFRIAMGEKVPPEILIKGTLITKENADAAIKLAKDMKTNLDDLPVREAARRDRFPVHGKVERTAEGGGRQPGPLRVTKSGKGKRRCTTVLEMQNITKRFPGVLALDHADISVESGEIHSLIGQNGAGKSTMMKILSGMYAADEGTITLDGKELAFRHPREALQKGIVTVYQELSLLSNLTVAENMFLGREPGSRLAVDGPGPAQEVEGDPGSARHRGHRHR